MSQRAEHICPSDFPGRGYFHKNKTRAPQPSVFAHSRIGLYFFSFGAFSCVVCSHFTSDEARVPCNSFRNFSFSRAAFNCAVSSRVRSNSARNCSTVFGEFAVKSEELFMLKKIEITRKECQTPSANAVFKDAADNVAAPAEFIWSEINSQSQASKQAISTPRGIVCVSPLWNFPFALSFLPSFFARERRNQQLLLYRRNPSRLSRFAGDFRFLFPFLTARFHAQRAPIPRATARRFSGNLCFLKDIPTQRAPIPCATARRFSENLR